MTPHEHPSSPGTRDDRPQRRPPRRALLAGLVIGLASAGAGAAAGAAILPRVEEVRRIPAEELGVDPAVLEPPPIAPIVDTLSEQIEDRPVDQTRRSWSATVLYS